MSKHLGGGDVVISFFPHESGEQVSEAMHGLRAVLRFDFLQVDAEALG